MENGLYILENGEVRKATSFEQWNKWMADHDLIISHHELDDISVCTAFIGRDLVDPQRATPNLFRTDIWVLDHAYQGTAQTRTLKEALVAHDEVLSELMSLIHKAKVIAVSAILKIQKRSLKK